MTYFGKQVGHGQIGPLDATVAAVAEYPVPNT